MATLTHSQWLVHHASVGYCQHKRSRCGRVGRASPSWSRHCGAGAEILICGGLLQPSPSLRSCRCRGAIAPAAALSPRQRRHTRPSTALKRVKMIITNHQPSTNYVPTNLSRACFEFVITSTHHSICQATHDIEFSWQFGLNLQA